MQTIGVLCVEIFWYVWECSKKNNKVESLTVNSVILIKIFFCKFDIEWLNCELWNSCIVVVFFGGVGGGEFDYSCY